MADSTEIEKEKAKVYFGLTTYQQRKLMIETYLETRSVKKACEQAKVVPNTFYSWYKRYQEEGWEGIEEYRSRAPKNHYRVPEEYRARAVELKGEQSKWGRRTIAYNIWKENGWEKVISPTAVENALREAGLWTSVVGLKKSPRKE